MKDTLPIITRPVLSYCEIPEKIAENHNFLTEASCDSFIEHEIWPKNKREGYTDNWDLDDWILSKWPKLEGEKILIHIDY